MGTIIFTTTIATTIFTTTMATTTITTTIATSIRTTRTTKEDQRTTIIGTALAQLAETAELPSAIRLPKKVSVTPLVAKKSQVPEIWKAFGTIATTFVIV